MRSLALLLPLTLWCCSPTPSDADPTPETQQVSSAPRFDPAAIERAEVALRGEPKVRDFLFDASPLAYTWQVGVVDDGSRRDGYAEYLCIMLDELGAVDNQSRIRVVDIAALESSSGDFRSAALGEADCASM